MPRLAKRGSYNQPVTAAVQTEYEVVVGLEVHAQLKTHSKMFCPCLADYFDAEPNSHVCPVCMGMPGVLPVINRRAVELTILTGLALDCDIPARSKFDRKNYPYPDLMKGYQISQFDQPLCVGGGLDVEVDGEARRIRLERIHLEEDTARLLHRDAGDGEGYSLLDINRAGAPLMEVVSEPDIRSSAEAVAYLRKLRQIFRYIGVSDADMEKGSFRCDANVSLRHPGAELGSKVEVKNMNSFRAIQRAIDSEIERQAEILDAGGTIEQETRGYIDATGETVSQRSKEEAHDYRYFPEPDLPPLETTAEDVARLRSELPELPDARKARFEQQYGLTYDEARILTESREGADSYEQAVELVGDSDEERATRARTVAHWFVGEVAALLNQAAANTLKETPLTPGHVAELVRLLDEGAITAASAKDVLQRAFESGDRPRAIVEAEGLGQVRDEGEIDAIARKVIEEQPKAVEDYRSGKDSAIKFLVGQVMRETRGRANPQDAQESLRRHLGSE